MWAEQRPGRQMPRLPSYVKRSPVHQPIAEEGTMDTPGPAPTSAEHPWYPPPSPLGWESGQREEGRVRTEEARPLPGPDPPLLLLALLWKPGTRGAAGGPRVDDQVAGGWT